MDCPNLYRNGLTSEPSSSITASEPRRTNKNSPSAYSTSGSKSSETSPPAIKDSWSLVKAVNQKRYASFGPSSW